MLKIAPSILSADFGKLAEQIAMVEEAGADIIHIDVMDGHFVPQITYGPVIIKKCKELSKLPLDVHLMVTNAEQTIDTYIDSGADMISIHAEAVTHLQRSLAYIRSKGVQAGVALNPATGIENLEWVWQDLDFILVMTVNPGFEAQKFIPACKRKLRTIKDIIETNNYKIDIEIDGGVGPANSTELFEAGANIQVAGSAIFKAKSPADVIKSMKNLS